MPHSLPRLAAASIVMLIVASRRADAVATDQTDIHLDAIEYRLENIIDSGRDLTSRFGGPEIALLEKINRADVAHLRRLKQMIVPSAWKTELDHSPFPATYAAASATPKLIIVDQPSQAFAAYEHGQQVYWGPISSGRKAKPTPSGLFHLNWRARSRISTLSGEWRLNWYFNFHNARGLAFHEFELPGIAMSHACVRLLARDAEWVFNWGQSWVLDEKRQLRTPGTPVMILGAYNFDAPPPWLAERFG
jgi:lipoprotein-anchoring transpeptidase ErfK/SrfK